MSCSLRTKGELKRRGDIGNEQVTSKKERKKEEASIPKASLPW
jgi:hypothetical protein